MKQKVHLVLHRDRTASRFLTTRYVDREPLGESNPAPFDHIPAMLVETLQILARHLNYVREDTPGEPDLPTLITELQGPEIDFHIEGEPRELEVCRIYMDAEFGFPVILEPFRDGRVSIYDTFGAETVVRPLERLASDVAQLERAGVPLAPKKKRKTDQPRWRRLLTEKKIRLGVTGDTGVGKSTFLNALVRIPDLLPTDINICTSLTTEVTYAPAEKTGLVLVPRTAEQVKQVLQNAYDQAEEYINTYHKVANKLKTPFWKKYQKRRGKREQLSERVKGEIRDAGLLGVGKSVTDAATKTAGWEKLKLLDALETAYHEYVQLAEQDWPRQRLDRLWHFVAAKRLDDPYAPVTNGWPSFLKSAKVYVDSPALQHLILIDTPGLRDPDPVRAKAALDIAKNFDGWLYLVSADPKANRSTLTPIEDLKQRSNVPHGVIIATKADLLWAAHSAKRTRRTHETVCQVFKVERGTHLESTGHKVLLCAPLCAQTLPETTDRDFVNKWKGSSWGYPFANAYRPCARVGEVDDHDDRLTRIERNFARSPDMWSHLLDFQLEISGLIPCIRSLLRLIEQDVVEKLVSTERRALVGLVAAEVVVYERRRKNLQRQLAADDLVRELEHQIEQKTSRLKALDEQTQQRLKDAKLIHDAQKELVSQTLEAERKSEKPILAKLKSHVAEAFHKKNRGFFNFWGERGLSIDEVVWIPKSNSASVRVRDYSATAGERLKSLDWLDPLDVDECVRRTTTNFHLEDGVTDIEEHKNVFEWSTTALARLQEKTKDAARKIFRTIEQNTEAKLNEIREELWQLVTNKQESWNRDSQSLTEELAKLQKKATRAREQVEVTRVELERELKEVETAVEKLLLLQSHLTQHEGPA